MAATTLAPRSWPSRPTLATSTRILRCVMWVYAPSQDGGLLPLAEHALHDLDDLAEGAIGTHRLQERRHGVLLAHARRAHTLERGLHLAGIAAGTHAAQVLVLLLLALLGDLED